MKREFWDFIQKYFWDTQEFLFANLILPSGPLNKVFYTKNRGC